MSDETSQPVNDQTEKKIYKIIDELKEYIPLNNDRNRLAYTLVQYKNGGGDTPGVLIKSTKIKITGISADELSGLITSKMDAEF